MFCFLGVFASPPAELEAEFDRLWPDSEFSRIESPVQAAAVRLTAWTNPSSEGELPSSIVDTLGTLSVCHPQTRFLLLRADCWGGDCNYCGKTIENGTIRDVVNGQQSLRRMIEFLGSDIGDGQIFEPLLRDFKWQKSRR